MLEVEIMEFGYSLENEKYFMRINIRGMEEKKKNKIIPMIVNIPLGDMKRFIIESNTDNALKILEYFPEEEYPFSKEIPTEEEIKKVEDMVKGFMGK